MKKEEVLSYLTSIPKELRTIIFTLLSDSYSVYKLAFVNKFLHKEIKRDFLIPFEEGKNIQKQSVMSKILMPISGTPSAESLNLEIQKSNLSNTDGQKKIFWGITRLYLEDTKKGNNHNGVSLDRAKSLGRAKGKVLSFMSSEEKKKMLKDLERKLQDQDAEMSHLGKSLNRKIY